MVIESHLDFQLVVISKVLSNFVLHLYVSLPSMLSYSRLKYMTRLKYMVYDFSFYETNYSFDMQQGHGFYNSSIVKICENHDYQIALGSLYPMDHMFRNQAKLLVKNMLWRVRFNFLLVDTLKLLIYLLLVLHSIGIDVLERFYKCKVFSYKTFNDLKGEVLILGSLHNMAKGRDHCEGP